MTNVTVPISTEPFPFFWPVEAQGYQWVRGLNSEWRLAARTYRGSPKTPRSYAPLKDQRLFLKFAALKTDRSSIRNFANRYGVLFGTYDAAVDRVPRPSGKYWSLSQLNGTSFARWKLEIETLHVLVQMWKDVRGARKEELKNVIHWRDDNSVGYKLGQSFGSLATPHLNQPWLERFKVNEILKPAMYLLQKKINERIADDTTSAHVAIVPCLVWCPGPRIDGVAKPDHHQRIVFQPTNLLAAMWLQFAKAVTDEYQLRVCEGCGEYFQIGKGARRIHAQTCSDRCRQRLSRRRRSSV